MVARHSRRLLRFVVRAQQLNFFAGRKAVDKGRLDLLAFLAASNQRELPAVCSSPPEQDLVEQRIEAPLNAEGI